MHDIPLNLYGHASRSLQEFCLNLVNYSKFTRCMPIQGRVGVGGGGGQGVWGWLMNGREWTFNNVKLKSRFGRRLNSFEN